MVSVRDVGGGRYTGSHFVLVHEIKRIKDTEGRGRREWVRENGLRWESWDAVASKNWVGMENTGRVADEGKAVFERVGLMEELLGNIHHQI